MDRTALLTRGVGLEYYAAGWRVIEAVVAVAAGIITGSVALIGFGLDSVIGGVTAGMLVWRLRHELRAVQAPEAYSITERKALFVSGITFFLLALYLLNESGSRLYYKEKPAESLVGLSLAAFSLIIMPALALMKLRVARALESRVLRVDAVETAIRMYLSFTLFLGLGLNAWLGWWWADPVAALLMIPFLFRAGWVAIEKSKENPSSGLKTVRSGF